jgi:hypothetical protein
LWVPSWSDPASAATISVPLTVFSATSAQPPAPPALLTGCLHLPGLCIPFMSVSLIF